MDLDFYLQTRKFSQKEFAKGVKVSAGTIANYIKGRRCPTLEIALNIEKYTDGKVTVEDLNNYWKRKKNG